MEIYGQDNALADKKGRSCRQDAVINVSIWLGVTMSQELLYKNYHTKVTLYTRFIEINKLPCVACTLKFENVKFEILKHGAVYNLVQAESDAVYIYLCQVAGVTTTEHYFS